MFSKMIFNSKSQKEYGRSEWRGFRAKIIDPFTGAAWIALIFGTISALTSGSVSKIFTNGIFEHAATVTLPLSFTIGAFLAGVAGLIRRKNVLLFRFSRYIANSCLILASNLYVIISGLCLGLAIPGALSGELAWLVIWPFMGFNIFMLAVVCHILIVFNYQYYRRSHRLFMYSLSAVLILIGSCGFIWSLEEASRELQYF